MIRDLLLRLVQHLDEPRVIFDREGGLPYLSRWYLIRKKPVDDDDLKGQSSETSGRRLFDLYLHCFHRSDDDQALHNHPWSWALSLVLCGGYTEERRVGGEVVRRVFRPPALNLIRGGDYHRVDLLDRDAWSLFLAGPKVDTWYFWDRNLKARMPWRKFIEVKRYGVELEWEPDKAIRTVEWH